MDMQKHTWRFRVADAHHRKSLSNKGATPCPFDTLPSESPFPSPRPRQPERSPHWRSRLAAKRRWSQANGRVHPAVGTAVAPFTAGRSVLEWPEHQRRRSADERSRPSRVQQHRYQRRRVLGAERRRCRPTPTQCDGNTIQGNTILPAADGSFTYNNYTVYALPDSSTSEGFEWSGLRGHARHRVHPLHREQPEATSPSPTCGRSRSSSAATAAPTLARIPVTARPRSPWRSSSRSRPWACWAAPLAHPPPSPVSAGVTARTRSSSTSIANPFKDSQTIEKGASRHMQKHKLRQRGESGRRRCCGPLRHADRRGGSGFGGVPSRPPVARRRSRRTSTTETWRGSGTAVPTPPSS